MKQKKFLESIYDAGAATNRIMISGKDLRTIIDRDNKENQQ